MRTAATRITAGGPEGWWATGREVSSDTHPTFSNPFEIDRFFASICYLLSIEVIAVDRFNCSYGPHLVVGVQVSYKYLVPDGIYPPPTWYLGRHRTQDSPSPSHHTPQQARPFAAEVSSPHRLPSFSLRTSEPTTSTSAYDDPRNAPLDCLLAARSSERADRSWAAGEIRVTILKKNVRKYRCLVHLSREDGVKPGTRAPLCIRGKQRPLLCAYPCSLFVTDLPSTSLRSRSCAIFLLLSTGSHERLLQTCLRESGGGGQTAIHIYVLIAPTQAC